MIIINIKLFALLLWVQAAGADALELNLSCPHGMGERGMGLACGQVGCILSSCHICTYILSHIHISALSSLTLLGMKCFSNEFLQRAQCSHCGHAMKAQKSDTKTQTYFQQKRNIVSVS